MGVFWRGLVLVGVVLGWLPYADALAMEKKLSSVYERLNQMQAKPYELQVPAFSDYAMKERVVYLPKGESAALTGDWVSYPDGTIIAKHFRFSTNEVDCTPSTNFAQNTAEHCLVETRFLVKQSGVWQPHIYVWQEDQQDALLNPYGASVSISGGSRKIASYDYQIPNLNECRQCHQGAFEGRLELLPIGPSLISRIKNVGIFAIKPKLSGHPVDEARQYLDINCSYCHNPSGTAASSGLFLRLQDPVPGICKRPVATGVSFGASFDVVPGKPKESILLKRMQSRDPQWQMPEIGSVVVDSQGATLIARWIRELEGGCDD